MFDFEKEEFEKMINAIKLGYHNADKIYTERRKHYDSGAETQAKMYGQMGLFQYKREKEYKVSHFCATASFFDAIWVWMLQSRVLFEQDKTYHADFKEENEYLCKRFIQICIRVLKVDIEAAERILKEIKEHSK